MLDIMSATGRLEEMEYELHCSICHDFFVQAYTLSCSHSFCLVCINAWKRRHSDCPICRQSICGMTPSRALDNMVATFQNGVGSNTSVPAMCDSTVETVPPAVLNDSANKEAPPPIQGDISLSSSDLEYLSSPEPEEQYESQRDSDDVSNSSDDDYSSLDEEEDDGSEEEDDDPITVSEGSYSAAEDDCEGEEEDDSNISNEDYFDEVEGYGVDGYDLVNFQEQVWNTMYEDDHDEFDSFYSHVDFSESSDNED